MLRGYELPKPASLPEAGVPYTCGLLKSISLVSSLDEDSIPDIVGGNEPAAAAATEGVGTGDLPITPGEDPVHDSTTTHASEGKLTFG